MYRVWFEGFIDRYYKSYNKAYEACRNFILNSCYNNDTKQEMLLALGSNHRCELCGIEEINLEDEIDESAQNTEKKKYRVIFTKYETIEVEAYNENEAVEFADEILDRDAYAWECPADRITVELIED